MAVRMSRLGSFCRNYVFATDAERESGVSPFLVLFLKKYSATPPIGLLDQLLPVHVGAQYLRDGDGAVLILVELQNGNQDSRAGRDGVV